MARALLVDREKPGICLLAPRRVLADDPATAAAMPANPANRRLIAEIGAQTR
jgi:hypothetical protein